MRKINVTLIFLILVSWIFIQILEVTNFAVNILLGVLLAINIILLHLSAINRKLSGELFIQQKRHSVNWFMIIYSMLLWINPISRYFGLALLAASIVSYLLYLYRKPVGIVVDRDVLHLNKLYLETRNVDDIRYLKLNGFLNRITIGFSDHPHMVFNKNVYEQENIIRLLELLLEKNPSVEVSQNLQDLYKLNISYSSDEKNLKIASK